MIMNLKKEDKIKSKLLINEDEIWEETLEIASKMLNLTSLGEVIIKIPEKKITLRERILLYSIGKRYAYEADIIEEPHITLEEFSREFRTDKKVLSARISELIRESKMRTRERGKYQVGYFDLREFLEEILSKIT